MHYACVYRVFTRIQRLDPNTLVTGIYQVAMSEISAADVLVSFTDKRDHNTNIANGDLGHGNLLDLYEPRIQVPCSRQYDLFL